MGMGSVTVVPAPTAAPSLLYAIKQVELAVRSHLDAILRPSGVTALQYTALTVLRRRSGLTSAELARNSFVATQSMADLVGALERQGLIGRRRDPADRRRMVIDLTDRGRRVLDEHDDAVMSLEESMVEGLSNTEVTALRNALNRCRGNLGDPSH